MEFPVPGEIQFVYCRRPLGGVIGYLIVVGSKRRKLSGAYPASLGSDSLLSCGDLYKKSYAMFQHCRIVWGSGIIIQCRLSENFRNGTPL